MAFDPALLWTGLGWPLIRLTFFISVGLFVGNLIESLNWTHAVAKVAAPLARMARLQDVSAASFSMAFFSGVAANTMLAEAHEKGQMSDKQLVLSNLFNSLPTYFLHLPTIFFIAAPFIGSAALVYVSLTVIAAVLRTAAIVLYGRMTLPPLPEGCVVCLLDKDGRRSFADAMRNTWTRFKKRLPKIVYVTAPIYAAFFVLKQMGLFDYLQQFAADHARLVDILPPEAMGIVAFHIAAEFTAGLAAAGAMIQESQLAPADVVLALLIGNVLSSPMRAVRHQFPYYAGIFSPRMALKLIVYNQTLRAASLALVAVAYFTIIHV